MEGAADVKPGSPLSSPLSPTTPLFPEGCPPDQIEDKVSHALLNASCFCHAGMLTSAQSSLTCHSCCSSLPAMCVCRVFVPSLVNKFYMFSFNMCGKVSPPRTKVTVDVFHGVGLAAQLAHVLWFFGLPLTLCLVCFLSVHTNLYLMPC